ncbi:MAG TPA: RNA polymerase sigma-70 factor [Pseudobacter sp.]|nr:RNA polymerase sigma-70 factor [Pseudobacter sp.]
MIAEDNNFNMAAFRQGDSRAVSSLFQLLYRPLVYFATGIIQHREEAEDIVVECFEKVMVKRKDFESLPNIRSFLYVATRNACYNYLRSLKVDARSQQELQYLHDPVGEARDYGRIESEVLHSILTEIEELPNQCRQIFKLLYFQQLDTREIADRMGLSIKTVRNQKARAIQLLQNRLLRKGLMPAVLLLQLMVQEKAVAAPAVSLY